MTESIRGGGYISSLQGVPPEVVKMLGHGPLSLKAKGLLMYMLLARESITLAELEHALPEGRDALRNAMNELSTVNAITREQERTSEGTFGATIYAVNERWVYENFKISNELTADGLSGAGKSGDGLPGDGLSGVENPEKSGKLVEVTGSSALMTQGNTSDSKPQSVAHGDSPLVPPSPEPPPPYNPPKPTDIPPIPLNDGSVCVLSEEKIERLVGLFPGVNVRAELLTLYEWNKRNPKLRQPTKAKLGDHIMRWLKRVDVRARREHEDARPVPPKRDVNTDEEVDYALS